MQVSEYFNSIGNKVESKYGTFILNRTGVKSSISAPIHLCDEDYYFAVVINVEKEKNSFYLHEVALQNKKDTLPFKTEPRHESGLLSDNVSIYSLLNKLQNVNNNDTKLSRDVNIDEFDETEYTNVKLSKAEYNKLCSEALTWDSDKVGQICYKYFNNKRYYYMLNEDNDIKILGVYNSNDKKGAEYKNVDRKRRNFSGGYEISENFDGYNNGDIGFVGNGRTATNNAELNKEEIQREGDSNGRRNIKNDNNDNLSEEKYSRDVDYAEYAELKRENKHIKEINGVLKHQFELTNGREVSTNSLLIAARKIIKFP